MRLRASSLELGLGLKEPTFLGLLAKSFLCKSLNKVCSLGFGAQGAALELGGLGFAVWGGWRDDALRLRVEGRGSGAESLGSSLCDGLGFRA